MDSKRDSKTLRDTIKRHVEPWNIIITDFWKDYVIEKDVKERLTVNHSIEFVNPKTCVNT